MSKMSQESLPQCPVRWLRGPRVKILQGCLQTVQSNLPAHSASTSSESSMGSWDMFSFTAFDFVFGINPSLIPVTVLQILGKAISKILSVVQRQPQQIHHCKGFRKKEVHLPRKKW